MKKDELRALFRELYYLKANDELAKGNLSRIIRNLQRQPALTSPRLMEYAEANIGLGANQTGEEKELFEERKSELLGRIGGQLVELGDESWVHRFDN